MKKILVAGLISLLSSKVCAQVIVDEPNQKIELLENNKIKIMQSTYSCFLSPLVALEQSINAIRETYQQHCKTNGDLEFIWPNSLVVEPGNMCPGQQMVTAILDCNQ